ncbi:MAG: hypothetical protein JHC95_13455 [Solirubrobacteraceae bacterium]|nr:hypothetical protein [Solirubrobacteraceae bacterium]
MFGRTLAFAGVAVLALALPVAAIAEPVQDLTVKATPNKASSKKSPKSAKLSVSLGSRETTAGVQPPTLSKAVIYFPAGAKYNGAKFPVCKATAIDAAKSTDECPAGSIIGKGKAAGQAPGGVTQTDLTIVAANGGKNKVNLFVEGASPLRIQSNIVGTMSPATGAYGLKLSVPVPANLQEPAPGVPVAITLFAVDIQKSMKKAGKTVPIFEITKCTGGTWKAKGEFSYAGGVPSKTVETSQKCTK